MNKKWMLLIVLSVCAPLCSVFFGAASLTNDTLYHCVVAQCSDPIDSAILWDIRLPRIIVGFLVGAGLSVAGATLQNVTRNGLADPYLFGVVAGAGLGASVATLFFNSQLGLSWGLPTAFYNMALPGSALIGAIFAVLLVQLLSHTTFGRRMEHMLLAGVAVSFMLSALSQFFLFVGDPFAANQVVFWLMGSLARVEAWYAGVMFVIVLVSIFILYLYGPQLDALLLGDDNAKTLGVNVTRMRVLSLLICAVLTAAIVAYCGGIGFVGLMIPHIIRHWLGVTSRILFLGSALLGGCFMVWVDVFARAAFDGREIPIGIITSAIGSVFFLLAMRQRQP
ncbi:iron ABC transporter permease [Alteromonas sp. 14N.309.X.WAT.G.H12]|uniref:FecCD family ABC transporter permease n=1 Tax=Alteromonas sp. 14N.309.X.WAT.G.H12 TaxID=3120824 RepID=UPI002FD0DA3A